MIDWTPEGLLYVGRRGGVIVATVRRVGVMWKWQRGAASGFAGTLFSAMDRAEVGR